MSKHKKYKPLVLTQETLGLLIEEGNTRKGVMTPNLIGLYMFYLYTGVWQDTDKPKCTNTYVAKGLNISLTRVGRLKRILIELGLIENVARKNKNNKITGHYIALPATSKSAEKPVNYITEIAHVIENGYTWETKDASVQIEFLRDKMTKEITKKLEGLTYSLFLKTGYWKAVARYMRKLRGSRCEVCSKKNKLQVHHKTYKHRGNEIEHLEDLVVLCSTCHKKEHNI